MKEQILKLRSEGKSYKEIQTILGCSKGTISYHCGEGQKEKTRNNTRKRRSQNSLIKKTDTFKSYKPKSKKGFINKTHMFLVRTPTGNKKLKMTKEVRTFNHYDVLKKIGTCPACYLTGRPINLKDPKSFQFDHILPASRGGTNTLDNLGILCKEANQAKGDLTNEEFLSLCKEVLEHNGYKVEKMVPKVRIERT